MTQWYYTNGRSKHGPIDEAGIRLRAQKGYVRRDTLLWRSGLAGWTRADELGFFPDDDVEPTLCAIPVPDGPPPIPQMQQTAAMPPMQPVAPQPPMAALPPPQPPYRAASVPVAPPPAAPRQWQEPKPEPGESVFPDDDGDDEATRETMYSGDEKSAGAFAPHAAPHAAPQPAPSVSVNVSGVAGQDVVSVANWFWTMLLMCIPLVNVILVFVWAFGGGAPASKSNWAKAILLWILVGIVGTVLFWGAIFGSVASMGR